jgi:hypothetical protein
MLAPRCFGKVRLLAQMDKRCSLEPFIETFARFDDSRDQDVLEIGVGLGADHQRFCAILRKTDGNRFDGTRRRAYPPAFRTVWAEI